MTALQQAAAARTAGLVTAREEARAYAEPEPFAEACGLSAAPGIYREIAPAEASAVLQAVLHRDLAHGVELMSHEQAQVLAGSLLAEYMTGPARCFTNGDFGRPRSNSNVGPGWRPATNSTFDTGIIVLARHKSLCFWVQDED